MDGPTHLYKHYGEGRKLLYVGVSLSALQRLLQHRRHAEWFDQIRMIKVKIYPTRKAALAAEKIIVKKCLPPFNEKHKPWTIQRHIAKMFGSYENWKIYSDDLALGVPQKEAYALCQERMASQPQRTDA